MLTFLIKSPGHKPYTKCLPSNAAALQDAQERFPGSAPASVVNLRMGVGQADLMCGSSPRTHLSVVADGMKGMP